jgi:hypothetical protein
VSTDTATTAALGLDYALAATIVASSEDRPGWLAARRRGCTATDVATLGSKSTAAFRRVLKEKRGEVADFRNASMDHGSAREPVIADWVQRHFGIEPSRSLYAHNANPRHLATPDGISSQFSFTGELAEIKTTNKPWTTIPRRYLRQVWWQQYVLGAERTLVVWEERDENFQPVNMEPEWRWVKRDEAEIAELKILADELLEFMDSEEPVPDPFYDERITRYLEAQDRRDEADAVMKAIEDEVREHAAGNPVRVFGTLGDLTLGEASTQTRFDSAAFKKADPSTYSRFQKTIGIRPRLTIAPLKREESTDGVED